MDSYDSIQSESNKQKIVDQIQNQVKTNNSISLEKVDDKAKEEIKVDLADEKNQEIKEEKVEDEHEHDVECDCSSSQTSDSEGHDEPGNDHDVIFKLDTN